MNKFSPMVFRSDEQSSLRGLTPDVAHTRWQAAMARSWALIFPGSIAVVVGSNEQIQATWPYFQAVGCLHTWLTVPKAGPLASILNDLVMDRVRQWMSEPLA